MKLYIQVRDGQSVGYPILEENLKIAFPDMDPDDPANGYAPFNRLPVPSDVTPGVFQKLQDTPVLGADGITWEDKWQVVDITDAEKADLIQQAQDSGPPYPNWILDITTLQWNAPIPMPVTGGPYHWDVQTNNWVSRVNPIPPVPPVVV